MPSIPFDSPAYVYSTNIQKHSSFANESDTGKGLRSPVFFLANSGKRNDTENASISQCFGATTPPMYTNYFALIVKVLLYNGIAAPTFCGNIFDFWDVCIYGEPLHCTEHAILESDINLGTQKLRHAKTQ